MKVSFRQSGGFSGLLSGCDLDTAAMDRIEATKLKALIAKSLAEGPPERKETVRDGMTYEIILEEGGGTRRIRFEDPAVPASAQPLLAFLRERSGPLKT